jgi:hypothetical protein
MSDEIGTEPVPNSEVSGHSPQDNRHHACSVVVILVKKSLPLAPNPHRIAAFASVLTPVVGAWNTLDRFPSFSRIDSSWRHGMARL